MGGGTGDTDKKLTEVNPVLVTKLQGREGKTVFPAQIKVLPESDTALVTFDPPATPPAAATG